MSNIFKETETLIDNNEKKVSEMDFVIDFSVSEPILDLNIKIGIFIGVALSVVTITGEEEMFVNIKSTLHEIKRTFQ